MNKFKAPPGAFFCIYIFMKPLSAGTVLNIKKPHVLGTINEYWNLKSRRKIKKKHGVKFIYEVEMVEWDTLRNKYILQNKEISFHSIRSLYQDKHPYQIQKTNENWDVLKAKIFLQERGWYED